MSTQNNLSQPAQGDAAPAMVQEVLRFCRWQKLFLPGQGVLVALSGGADSVCLLAFLAKYQQALGISQLAALHVNHQLRGQEAQKDAAFCQRLCADWKVPFFSQTAEVAAFAQQNAMGVEEAARILRYDLLCEEAKRLAKTHQTPFVVALAHHAGDQAETVLQHLLRGSGLNGLCGMHPKRQQQEVWLVRPFLTTRPEALRAYLKAHALSFVEDSTNQSDFCLRNRLRHHLLPLMQAENPNFVQTLAQNTLLWQAQAQTLNRLAASAQQVAMLPTQAGEWALSATGLKSLPLGVQEQVLFDWLQSMGLPPSAKGVLQLQQLLLGEIGQYAPNDRFVFRLVGDRLVATHLPQTDASSAEEVPLDLTDDQGGFCWQRQTYLFQKVQIVSKYDKKVNDPCEIQKKIMESSKNYLFLAMNYDKIKGALRACDWHSLPDDAQRFVPVGFAGHQTLSKLIGGWHLTPKEQERLLVLADDLGIVGVMSDKKSRVAARVAVCPQTTQLLWVSKQGQPLPDFVKGAALHA